MRIILIRHGKSLRSKIGIWGRTLDLDLDNDFLFQMEATKQKIGTLTEFEIFSSPLKRCVQTAQHIFNETQNIKIVDEIRAYHSGFFEDKKDEFIKTNYPDYLTKSYKERFLFPQFNEESIFEQIARVKIGLNKILNLSTSSTVVISTHYSVINVIANIANSNFDSSSYAEGKFEILEGGYIDFVLEKKLLFNNLNQ